MASDISANNLHPHISSQNGVSARHRRSPHPPLDAPPTSAPLQILKRARMHDLPSKFKKLLVPGKIQQILCTGNVSDKETFDYLRTVATDIHVVKGDYDESNFPLSVTVNHSPIRIGVINGYQAVPWGDLDSLSGIARTLDVDVLVSGHTHVFQAQEYEGRFFVNPGSASGAWHGSSPSNPTPSFALMDIQGSVIVTYVYQLIDGEVRVEKMEYRKPAVSVSSVVGENATSPRVGAVTSPGVAPPVRAGAAGPWN